MNVIDAINRVIEGVNLAYSRGAYTMAETHDLHVAIELIKQAANTPQQPVETNENIDSSQELKSSAKKNTKEKDDY
jgi:hypothetical protein